ncbi:MAG: winged helix-turn-helix transcriptional regulator [Saprospiraceae bacterium]|nr:winged helix-turn-helix transcriptional regulator [Saprospiraceae bacterium]
MNKHSHPALPEKEKLRETLVLMRALAHPLRLSILRLIDNHKEVSVGDIYKTLKIEQALASQQLRILRQAQLVHTRREQKFVYYSINYLKIEAASLVSKPLAQMINA